MSLGDEIYIDIISEPKNSQVFVKSNYDRTVPDDRRTTSFYEEMRALKTMHSEEPDYFPEPFYAVREKTDSPLEPDPVIALVMENLEPVSTSGSNFLREEDFWRLTETVTNLSIPHGDLYGNIWMTENNVVISDPKGYADDPAESRIWRKDDLLDLRKIAKEQELGEYSLEEIREGI